MTDGILRHSVRGFGFCSPVRFCLESDRWCINVELGVKICRLKGGFITLGVRWLLVGGFWFWRWRWFAFMWFTCIGFGATLAWCEVCFMVGSFCKGLGERGRWRLWFDWWFWCCSDLTCCWLRRKLLSFRSICDISSAWAFRSLSIRVSRLWSQVVSWVSMRDSSCVRSSSFFRR